MFAHPFFKDVFSICNFTREICGDRDDRGDHDDGGDATTLGRNGAPAVVATTVGRMS